MNHSAVIRVYVYSGSLYSVTSYCTYTFIYGSKRYFQSYEEGIVKSLNFNPAQFLLAIVLYLLLFKSPLKKKVSSQKGLLVCKSASTRQSAWIKFLPYVFLILFILLNSHSPRFPWYSQKRFCNYVFYFLVRLLAWISFFSRYKVFRLIRR